MEYTEYEETEGASPEEEEEEEEETEEEGTEEEGTEEGGAGELTEQIGELVDALSSSSGYGTMGDYYNESLGFYVFPGREVLLSFVSEEEAGEEWCATLDGHYVPADCLEKYEAAYAAAEDGEGAGSAPTQAELDTLALLEEISGTLARMEEDSAACREDMEAYAAESSQAQEDTYLLQKDAALPLLLCCALFLAFLCGIKLADIFFGRLKT